MPSSSSPPHQASCRQPSVFGDVIKGIGPSERQPHAYHGWHPAQQGWLQDREQVPEGVNAGGGAEINPEGQYQLYESRARFSQFQNGSPQQISEHYSGEVQILSKFHYETAGEVVLIFSNN